MRRWLVLSCVIAFLCVSSSPGWARSWRAESRYPIIRNYISPKDPALAEVLSTVFPGMGQIYASSPGKGMLFLFAEATLFIAAMIQIDRAVYYDDFADRYELFYDEYTDEYLTYEQGYSRARGHRMLGAGLLLASAGVHLWNIQDAVQTAQRYNRSRRLSFEIRTVPETQLACRIRF